MIERLSALKILHDELSKHAVHRERFLREARAVNRINHPNIVEISDLGEADGIVYLVMEFVDGPTLHEVISRGVLPWARAVRIGLQIAAALGRAHQMGVVHRDLKPENILLDMRRSPAKPGSVPPSQDAVKLTDFGIAKILDEPALTVGEHLFGTPGYIAPEYLEGATSDPRSDIYSLGVVLYEATTGRLPYDGDGAALLAAQMRSDPIPPSERVAGYLPGLDALVLRLLARDPARRPQDAFALHDLLAALLRAETAGAYALGGTLAPPGPLPAGPPTMDAEVAATLGRAPTDPALALPVLKENLDPDQEAVAGVAKWSEALVELEAGIAAARRSKVPPQRTATAAEIAERARLDIALLASASRTAFDQQRRVDELEAEGRVFRADIGRAIDELVLDRSRARAHRVAAKEWFQTVAADTNRRPRPDALVWESAALRVESGVSEAAERDIDFQIAALERSLTERNAAFEGQLLEASGALEGSLAAVERLRWEIERSIRDASELVREADEPRESTRSSFRPRAP
jgi:serine/threonine-protein kinase